jgi:hypothetical protein
VCVSKDGPGMTDGPHASPGDAKHRPATRTGRRKRRRGLLTMKGWRYFLAFATSDAVTAGAALPQALRI